MKHLQKFSGFNTLNEVSFTRHYQERTYSEISHVAQQFTNPALSRILPYGESTPKGWRISKMEVLDSAGAPSGQSLSYEEFIKSTNLDSDVILGKIEYAIFELSRSKKLEDFTGSTSKEFKALCLGKIGVRVGDKIYSPTFKLYEGDRPSQSFTEDITGNTFWAVVSENQKAVTLLLFGENQESDVLNASYNDYRWRLTQKTSSNKYGTMPIYSEKEFRASYLFEYPYGKDFMVVIDPDVIGWRKSISDLVNDIKPEIKVDKERKPEKQMAYVSDPNYQPPPGPQQFNMGEGRRLMVYEEKLPSKGYHEVEIVYIMNNEKEKYKTEGYFQVMMTYLDENGNPISFTTPSGNVMNPFKKPVKLKPGDSIKVLAGGEYRSARVLEPFYVLDRRLETPENLRYVFI
jgi:hypothetical protein